VSVERDDIGPFGVAEVVGHPVSAHQCVGSTVTPDRHSDVERVRLSPRGSGSTDKLSESS
jgi:hypothetical protein